MQVYGSRLICLAVFGSVGRGNPRFDSDVDIPLVAADLPHGRLARMREFDRVEAELAPVLDVLRREGVQTELAPVFKTPAEVEAASPLFLDMVEDTRILYDRDGFLCGYLERLRRHLKQLGARRVSHAGAMTSQTLAQSCARLVVEMAGRVINPPDGSIPAPPV